MKNPLRALSALVIVMLGALAPAQNPPIPIGRLLGSWEEKSGAVITLKSGDGDSLTLTGGKGMLWVGSYTNGELEFTAKPNSDAMNPSIPAWARQQVQGVLEWRLKLTPSETPDGLKLKGQFLPGEVQWNEVSDTQSGTTVRQTASVTGVPGTPIPLTYTKSVKWSIANTIIVVAKQDTAAAGGRPYIARLFAYGPNIPNSRTGIKGSIAPGVGVKYTLLGCLGDKATMEPQDAALLAQGWQQAKTGISAEDAKTLNSQWGGMLILARVDPNVLPGWQPFTLASASSGWYLDTGTGTATVAFWRQPAATPDHDTPAPEPTNYIYEGENVRIQVHLGPSTFQPSLNQVPLTLAINGTFMECDGEIDATPDPTTPNTYSSPPIRIVHEDDPSLPDGMRASVSNGQLLVAAEAGDNIQLAVKDDREFLMTSPVANLFVSSDDEGPWKRAIDRATSADQISSESPTKTVVLTNSNVILSQIAFKLRLQYLSPYARFIQWLSGVSDATAAQGSVIRSVDITLGEQAAAILMRDEFLDQLNPVVDALNAVKSDNEKIAFLGALYAQIVDPKSAIGSVTFQDNEPLGQSLDGYNGSPGSWTLREAITFKGNQALRRRLLLVGFDAYRSSVADALKQANSIGDDDIYDLLALTGDSFAPISASLMPKLMRPLRDSTGAVTWEPDPIARAEVKNIDTGWAATKAQQQWSALDTSAALAAATIGLQLAGAPAWLLISANFAATAQGTYEALTATGRDEAEARFAIGSYQILGNDRYDMAQVQKTPSWVVLLNLVSLGMASSELYSIAGSLSAGEATVRATAIAQSVKSGGLAELSTLAPRDQTALLLEGAAVEAKTVLAANAVKPDEAAIQQAVAEIQKELEGQVNLGKPGEPTAVVPEVEKAAVTTSPNPKIEPDWTQQGITYQFKNCEALPSDFPQATGPYSIGGKPFNLSKLLGEGSFFVAFVDATTGRVLKIGKRLGTDAVELYKDMQTADRVLRDCQVEFLPCDFGPSPTTSSTDLMWMTQQNYNTIPGAKMVRTYVVEGSGKLTSAQTDAVCGAINKLFKGGSWMEDFKGDNIFLRPEGNDWVCGVLDVDRVAEYGDLTEAMSNIKSTLYEGKFGRSEKLQRQFMEFTRGMVSKGNRQLTLEEVWKVQLVRSGFLKYSNTAKKLVSGTLNIDEVLKRLPWLGDGSGVIDLTKPATSLPAGGLLFDLRETLGATCHGWAVAA